MGFRFASTAFVAGLSAALSIAAPPASAQIAPLSPRVALKVGAIGAVSDAGVAIASGLTGTERVVLSAGAFLNPGQKIKPVVARVSSTPVAASKG